MDMFLETKGVFHEVAKGNWEFVVELYKEHPDYMMFPINMSRDTIFHMAIFSEKKNPFDQLLAILKDNSCLDKKEILCRTNANKNTIIHEAAAVGNLQVIDHMIGHDKDILFELMKKRNDRGELPLFRAAAYGKREIVERLALLREEEIVKRLALLREKELGEKEIVERLASLRKEDNEIEYRRLSDSKSILQVAIEGEYFDTALSLLEYDESLAKMKDGNDLTALHCLANMPSAFESGKTMGFFENLIYSCLPVADHIDSKTVKREPSRTHDLESGQRGNCSSPFIPLKEMKSRISQLMEKLLLGLPMVKGVYKEKQKHELALTIATILIEKTDWVNQFRAEYHANGVPLIPSDPSKFTPLFIATKTGIIEIVSEIFKANPQTLEHLNENGQNILHVAIMYRRKDIFHQLKDMEAIWHRLTQRTDDAGGYNLLHHVADTLCYDGGTATGPAFQLQEELLWFNRVMRIVPSYHLTVRANVKISKDDKKIMTPKELFELKGFKKKSKDGEQNKEQKADAKEQKEDTIISLLKKKKKEKLILKMTPKELFELRHREKLKEAQDWIKNTTQSCSTVGALVATVVFAAAYTAPGGTNEKGLPIFLYSPYFMFFTIMDVIALACSLTSVVAFLSIQTSPLEFQDFHRSIPRTYSFGFILLFLSVITTMLAFGSTILLVIRSQQHFTASLISIAAFLPVSVFALLQFRFYRQLLKDGFRGIGKAAKSLPFPRRSRKRMLI